MNEMNFEKLKDRVKYTGFREGLESRLKENMQNGLTEFKLEHQAIYGNDIAKATLHFRKSDQQDNYFFNKYDLSVNKIGEKDGLKQSFEIGYDNNITLREGYNLLSGRSVHKEMAKLVDTGQDGTKRLEPKGEKYFAWLKMDLTDKHPNGNFKIKQYHQNYGFDLEAVLSRFPIKELGSPEEKNRLIDSMKKGNLQLVTFVIDGKEDKRFIEAAPQFKSINQFDKNLQRTGLVRNKSEKEGEDQKQGESEKSNASKSKKEGSKQDSAEKTGEKKEKNTKRKAPTLS